MKLSNFIWGIILILGGVLLGLNALGYLEFNLFFKGWWTLFIIIPSLVGLLKDQEKTLDIIFLIIGIFLFLAARGIITYEILYKLFFPLVLVILGLSLIFKDTINSKTKRQIKKLNKKNLKEYTITFSSQTLDFTDEKFTGASFNSIFATLTCNLIKSEIKDNTLVKVESLFGKVIIKVPKNIKVQVVSNSLFGGVTNLHHPNDSEKTLYIEAKCLFGGVEIND